MARFIDDGHIKVLWVSTAPMPSFRRSLWNIDFNHLVAPRLTHTIRTTRHIQGEARIRAKKIWQVLRQGYTDAEVDY